MHNSPMARRARLVEVPEPDPERMAAEYAAGATSRQMEARYRLSWRRIKALIAPYRVEVRAREPQRQHDPGTVHKLRAQGMSHGEIAAAIGISQTRVRGILRGARWDGLSDPEPAITNEEILAAARRGWTQGRAAEEYQVSTRMVQHCWRRMMSHHGVAGSWSAETAQVLAERMRR